MTSPSPQLSRPEAVDVAVARISFEPTTTEVRTGERRGRDVLDDQLFGQFQRCHELPGQTPVQADASW